MFDHTARQPHGHCTEIGPWGEIKTHDFICCCHCKKLWEVVRGSGRSRGWCYKCSAPTCSLLCAVTCLPYEAQLENIEAGRPQFTERPTMILVPESPVLLPRLRMGE